MHAHKCTSAHQGTAHAPTHQSSFWLRWYAWHSWPLPLAAHRRPTPRVGACLQVAGVILEPVVGNGGFIAPDPAFLQGLRDLCTQEGAVLCFDEVMTGFRIAKVCGWLVGWGGKEGCTKWWLKANG